MKVNSVNVASLACLVLATKWANSCCNAAFVKSSPYLLQHGQFVLSKEFGSEIVTTTRGSRYGSRTRSKVLSATGVVTEQTPSLDNPFSTVASTTKDTTTAGPCRRLVDKNQIPKSAYKDPESVMQIEREIVKLGRKGRISQVLEIFWSIDRPVIRHVNAVIDACSRSQPVRLELAFEILRNSTVRPNVYTFGSLMSVCARAGSVTHAVQVLKYMETEYGVAPNAVVYNTAVSSCSRADPPQPAVALRLLQEARDRGIPMGVVGYNAAIAAAAGAGDWKGALNLLTEMEKAAACRNGDHDGNHLALVPHPDAVSYWTVLSAFEKAQEWQRILEYAEYMESKGQPLDGLAITSVLHACQSLALPTEAIRYLNMMKEAKYRTQVERKTAGRELPGARAPLDGPDAVAYLLAVSACARGGAWIQGLELLNEYSKTPAIKNPEVDVSLFTAAIKGCEYAGQYNEAFLLLDFMRKNNVHPNEVALAAVIGACATACAKLRAGDQQQQHKQQQHKQQQQKTEVPEAAMEPKLKALRLLKIMERDETIPSPNTLVYNAAVRACAEAHDLKGAFKVFERMRENNVEPNICTFGSLMTACERVGSTDGMSKAFTLLRETGFEANDVIFGAAISCCRKAGESERAILLLRKMIKQGLEPNIATYNTVLMAQAEAPNTENLARVYKLLSSSGEGSSSSSVKPNRQTFNIIIRAFAEKKQPKEAEAVLRLMHGAGFVPDVDLYTLVVSAYERTGQPLLALRLMESMNDEGYAFYEDKVLDAAFKKAVKMANIVGRKLSADEQPWSFLDDAAA